MVGFLYLAPSTLAHTGFSDEIVQKALLLPKSTDLVGFERESDLRKFRYASVTEPDQALRAYVTYVLQRADINADRCLSRREFEVAHGSIQTWKRAPLAEHERAISAFFHKSKWYEIDDDTISKIIQRIRSITSVAAKHLFVQRVVQIGAANTKFQPEDLTQLESMFRAYENSNIDDVRGMMNRLAMSYRKCQPKPIDEVAPLRQNDALRFAIEAGEEALATLDKLDGPSLLSGKAGAAMFFAQLYRHSAQEKHLTIARNLMLSALKEHRADATQDDSLMTGRAGISMASLNVYRALGERQFLDIALSEAEAIRNLTPDTEYAFGATGIGILMLNLHHVTRDARWLQKAREIGEYFAHSADRIDQKARWKWNQIDQYQPGYGHGVSGIGEFLARLYEVTGTPFYKQLAIESGNYVLSLAFKDRDGGLHWSRHAPMLDAKVQYQWSHGSPGIGHLFLALHRIEPHQRKWKRALEGSIKSTVAEGRLWRGKIGVHCCGKSGSGQLLIEAFHWTKKKEYFKEALKFGQQMIENGKLQFVGEGSVVDPGLFFGISGIGHFFLRLHDPLTTDMPAQIWVR